MKKFVLLGSVCLMLASCSTSDPTITQSIAYPNGQPRTKLTKSPIGSTFTNQVTDEYGRQAIETYRIQPDRSVKFLRRETVEKDFFSYDR